MSLHNDSAIIFEDVSKIYRMYKSRWQMALDAFGFAKKLQLPEFFALRNINLTINKGERIGLIGRNGAGKSTLLKLITENFAPTKGAVHIHGKVQALMSTGLGFHPEFSGMENIKSSLLYNGLSKDQFKSAIDDVVDFVELGEFLYQPLKTYSLGMQSRLYFAVATAIQPEILIVDEVLGAGDAYFSAKSAERMKKLTNSGCTLLLVSHSTAQVLQFCDKAIWLENGEVTMQGEAITVIKAYEDYSKRLEMESLQKHSSLVCRGDSVIQSKWLKEKLLKEVLSQKIYATGEDSISRWASHEDHLKISKIRLLDSSEEPISYLVTGQALQIEITITADKTDHYDIYFMILLFTEDGQWLSRHCSDKYQIFLTEGKNFVMKLKFDEILLGNGRYIFSAGLYKILDLNDLSTARYYDLLSRSFEFTVKGLYPDDNTVFHHPAKWQIEYEKSKSEPEIIEAMS